MDYPVSAGPVEVGPQVRPRKTCRHSCAGGLAGHTSRPGSDGGIFPSHTAIDHGQPRRVGVSFPASALRETEHFSRPGPAGCCEVRSLGPPSPARLSVVVVMVVVVGVGCSKPSAGAARTLRICKCVGPGTNDACLSCSDVEGGGQDQVTVYGVPLGPCRAQNVSGTHTKTEALRKKDLHSRTTLQ